jgi:hypothetical protein
MMAPAILSADEKLMEAWWADLEKGETDAMRALFNLSAAPNETVAFLKPRMKPLRLSSGQAKSLQLKQGNGEEAIW